MERTARLVELNYLINYFLEQFRTTLYRQTMFAEFELKINEMQARGEAVTSDELCRIYGSSTICISATA